MITIRADLCPANHPCPSVHACPAGAISQNGNQAPVVDQELCTDCGMCTYTCPVFVEEPDVQAEGRLRKSG